MKKELLEKLDNNQEFINKELSKIDTLSNALLNVILRKSHSKVNDWLEDVYNLIDLIQERQAKVKITANEQERLLIEAEELL